MKREVSKQKDYKTKNVGLDYGLGTVPNSHRQMNRIIKPSWLFTPTFTQQWRVKVKVTHFFVFNIVLENIHIR